MATSLWVPGTIEAAEVTEEEVTVGGGGIGKDSVWIGQLRKERTGIHQGSRVMCKGKVACGLGSTISSVWLGCETGDEWKRRVMAGMRGLDPRTLAGVERDWTHVPVPRIEQSVQFLSLPQTPFMSLLLFSNVLFTF